MCARACARARAHTHTHTHTHTLTLLNKQKHHILLHWNKHKILCLSIEGDISRTHHENISSTRDHYHHLEWFPLFSYTTQSPFEGCPLPIIRIIIQSCRHFVYFSAWHVSTFLPNFTSFPFGNYPFTHPYILVLSLCSIFYPYNVWALNILEGRIIFFLN